MSLNRNIHKSKLAIHQLLKTLTRDSQAPKPVFPEGPEFLFASSMFAVS